MDKYSEARLKDICPVLAELVRKLAQKLSAQGVEIRVVQGLRSWNEQQRLYDKGRTAPGQIVTRCQPGYSWHNFGLAVDVAPDDPALAGYQADWNGDHQTWKLMEGVARSLGFTCGADFRTFPDQPHLQLTGRFPVNPTGEVRQIFIEAGMRAIWEEAGLLAVIEAENVAK